MDDFITPFETEISSEEFAEMAYQYIQARFPDYVPRPSQIDTAIIQANALLVQELSILVREVSVEIFTAFASKFLGVDRVVANRATGAAEFETVDDSGHLIPAGTQISVKAANGEIIAFETTDDLSIGSGDTTGEVAIIAVESGKAASGLSGYASLLTNLDSVLAVSLVGTTINGRDDETLDEYVARMVRRLRIYAPRPILPGDFAELALDLDGVQRALVRDLFVPMHNLLTANQASVETDTAGFVTGLANTSTSRVGSGGFVGNALLRSTAAGTGTVLARTSTGTSGFPVTGGKTYTVGCAHKRSVTASIQIGFLWYDAAGSPIGGAVVGPSITSQATWTETTFAATAPGNAAYGAFAMQSSSIAAAQYVDLDAIWVREGAANVGYAPGGTAAEGNARTVAIAALDENGDAISDPSMADLVAYLQAAREVNFVVLPMQPDVKEVAIATTVSILPGFDPDTIQADVQAAIESAFSPRQWGSTNDEREWRYMTKLRRSEVSEVINRVNGVDFWSTLTLDGGTADIVLSGGAPLVSTTATVTIGTEAP